MKRLGCLCASVLALGCARLERRLDSALQPREGACGQVSLRPVDLSLESLFSVGGWIVSLGQGEPPGYAPDAAVLDTRSGAWSKVPPDGAPELVQGYTHYGIQWRPLSTRLFGVYGLGLVTMEPEGLRWRVVPRPPGFDDAGLISWDDTVLTASHRFDAVGGQLSPAPPWVREHASTPIRIPLGPRIALLDPAKRQGELIDLETNRRTPIRFEGFPAFAQVIQGSAVRESHLLLLGRAAVHEEHVHGALYDLGTGKWTLVPASTLSFLHATGLHRVSVGAWGGAWLAEPEGPAGVRDLYLLDPVQVTVVKASLPRGAQAVGSPRGVYVFDGERMRLFVPGRADPVCQWPLPSVPKNRMVMPSGKVLDQAEGLDAYGAILLVGPRVLLVSSQSEDHNPSCPPGAPCVPHQKELVDLRIHGTLLEWR